MSDIKRAARFTVAALLVLAGVGAAGTAHAATPPKGAFTYVGNVDDGARSGVVDRRNFLSGASKTFSTALDGSDDMAVGDVTGDGFDEILVADDGEGRIDVRDTSSGAATSFHTPIGQDVFAYDDVHDDLAAGNVTGDSKDEIIVGDANFGMIIVYSATGEKLKTLSGLAVDGNDLVVAGDFLPGKGLDEIAIVNSEDEGRIDVFDINRNLLQVRHSGFDGSGDDVAVGDVTGDLAEEVIVANDEEGRPRLRGLRHRQGPQRSLGVRLRRPDRRRRRVRRRTRRHRHRQHRGQPHRRHQLLRRRAATSAPPTTATTASPSAASARATSTRTASRTASSCSASATTRATWSSTSRAAAPARAARTSWSKSTT